MSARLVLRKLKDEVFPFVCPDVAGMRELTDRQQYRAYFPRYVRTGIDCELLQPALAEIFDLERLAAALAPERDQQFQFLGLQTLYDRYFLHSGGTRIELPQAFFMRVAMGLAQREAHPDERAIEFYELLSSFDFMCSTPTLFNSGTVNPQLSSCFLSTVPDDLAGIFKAIKDNALLSKFSGGLGNDWSRVRGLGAHIKGTNGGVPGGSFRSSRWPTTRPWPSIRAVAARGRSAPTSRCGTSTSTSSSTCARTRATTGAAPTT